MSERKNHPLKRSEEQIKEDKRKKHLRRQERLFDKKKGDLFKNPEKYKNEEKENE